MKEKSFIMKIKKYNCSLKIIVYINTKKGYNNSIYCFSKLVVNRYKVCVSLQAG